MAEGIKQSLSVFDGKNYPLWKFKAKALLIAGELWDTVTKDGKPADGAQAVAIAAWKKKADKVMSILAQSLSDTECLRVVTATTPKQIFDILDARYLNRSVQNKIILRKRLLTIKMQEGSDLQEHLTAFENILNELQGIGVNLPEEDKAIHLIMSLPDSYSATTQSLEMQQNLDYQTVKNTLINADLMRKAAQGETAMFTKTSRLFTPRHPNKKTTPQCDSHASSKQDEKTCNFCGGKNHLESKCFHKEKMSKAAKEELKKKRKERAAEANNNAKLSGESSGKGKKKDLSYLTLDTALLAAEQDGWYFDCAATRHMSRNREAFIKLKSINPTPVAGAGGHLINATGIGTIELEFRIGDGQSNRIRLTDAFYVPNLCTNLFSIGRAQKKGATFGVADDKYTMYSDGELTGVAHYTEGLFKIDCIIPEHEAAMNTVTTNDGDGDLTTGLTSRPDNRDNSPDATTADGAKDVGTSAVPTDTTHTPTTYNTDLTPEELEELQVLELWHYQLGHMSIQQVADLAKSMADGVETFSPKVVQYHVCQVCAAGKGKKNNIPKTPARRAESPLERIFSDVGGPTAKPSKEGYRYWATFTDDKTRFGAIFFMKAKSDVLKCFKEYHAWACNQMDAKIKLLRTDEGGKYSGKEIQSFLQQEGIQPELTAPYSPFQNGTSERRNRQLEEITRCIILAAGLDDQWWTEVMQFAN